MTNSKVFSQKIDHLVSFRNIDSESYFRFNYDNDYFDSSDKDYTQGCNIELVAPILKQNPLNIFLLTFSNHTNRYGISFEHIGFTPDDIVATDIQFGDRPYSAIFLLKTFSISENNSKKIRLTSQFNLGLIGPVTLGEQMQTGIHKAINDPIPRGWENQIKNDFILNYSVTLEKQIFNFRNIAKINANANLNIGTLFSNTFLGFNSSIGIFNRPGKSKNFECYVYAQPLVSFVGYDATLQGGFFTEQNVYTIASSQIERFVYHFNWGAILKFKNVYLEYSRTIITKEFETGHLSGWGGIKIGFHLRSKK